MRRFAVAVLSAAFLAALPAAAEPPAGADLFANGLTDWTYHLADPAVKMEDVWTYDDGILTCLGRPAGYLRTKKEDYADYVLTLEWRWHTGRGGNSGVLVHTTTPGALGVWPKSVEVQLAAGNAGDFWVIGTELTVPNVEQRRLGRRHLNLTDDAERPLGEWNEMEIVCRGDEIVVRVNGDLVNHATEVNVTSGAIALQSEGTPVQFRNVRLRPLE